MCNKCNKNKCDCNKVEFCGCKTKIDLLCSLYTGDTLETLDIKKGTTGNDVIKKINDYLETKEDTDPIILDNVGTGSSLFKGISDDYKYDLKSLVKGEGILITEQEDTVTISIDQNYVQNLVQQIIQGQV